MADNYVDITPQDLGSVISVLQYISNRGVDLADPEMSKLANELLTQYQSVFEIQAKDKLKLPYNRKDYSTILEYLKLQAEQLSEGRWNDFSDSDLGTVLLKLMSYLGDIENYNIDKSIAELYLSTCTERASALLLCKLIGYEPRHYMSAETDVWLGAIKDQDGKEKEIPNGTIFPRGSVFTTNNINTKYTTLKDAVFTDNLCKVTAYEGILKEISYTLSDVDDLGRIILPDYNIAFNTAQLFINGEEYKRVENVTINTGELAFSVHCSEDRYIYLQLPAFWPDVLIASSNIVVSYCLSTGIEGRLGKDRLTELTTSSSEKTKITILSNTQSIEGYNPETINEIKIHAPIRARTMDTIVTLKDFEEVGSFIDGVADIKALDYNDPTSGLIQPTPGPGGYVNDAYKVNIYVLPDTVPYDEENPENNKYRNTIIKAREDWEWSDMGKVAKDVTYFAKASISGNQITIPGEATTYDKVDDIILGVDTLHEVTSYLPKYVSTIPGKTDDFEYTINLSNDNIIITMCTNWKDFMTGELDKLAVFFKQEQILTKAGQELREYIDERRLHSLVVTYYDVSIINPEIYIEIYMDSRNIEFESIATKVKDFVLDKYSRKYLKCGDAIFASVIGADILDNFENIKYVEVGLPTFTDDLVETNPKQFLDIIPPKITTKAIDYRSKGIAKQ